MGHNSTRFLPYKDRKAVATELKEICLASCVGAAGVAPQRFAEKWDVKYPAISEP